jgi:UDP-N-acetylglucosamine 2-epimerase (non-hydrolysing)
MKVKPVMAALERRGTETLLVHTGQHYDESLSDVFLQDLGIRAPDRTLGAGSGTHAEQTARVMMAFDPILAEWDPAVVVVVGDVNSTMACAVTAAKAGPLVAHVEAGLRSRDWSMPEEVNRVVTDRVSDYLMAPSRDAVDNLLGEGYRNDQVHLVGNVMIDTLISNLERARRRPILGDLGLRPGEYGLVTAHRPANVDGDTLLLLLRALEEVANELPLVFPVHPRTRRQLRKVPSKGLIVIDPVGYLDFLAMEASARLVLTDSGGVQEETTVLGVPCLTLRDNTERPVTLTEGTNILVGRDPDRIVGEARRVLKEGVERRCPELWDGKAGERIAQVIVGGGLAEARLRPTALGPSE